MRFSLVPREMKFFDMFDETVTIVSRAAGQFVELVTVFDRLPERGRELKAAETACDEIVAQIITALDQTFITPFDREDIHGLATALDDILDNMEETAYRFVEFRIDRPSPEAVQLACIIRDCCLRLEQSVRLLRNMKRVDEIRGHLHDVARLENDADNIYRACDSALFAHPPDTLTLIKLRELYGWLEETVDACKDTALVITEIIVKGS